MINTLTPVTPALLQVLQSLNYQKARRELRAIRDAVNRPVFLVWHLAEFWGVPADEIVSNYKTKK
jgi:transcriptional regulator of met regulon